MSCFTPKLIEIVKYIHPVDWLVHYCIPKIIGSLFQELPITAKRIILRIPSQTMLNRIKMNIMQSRVI
jgi:hypothetical protein